MREAVVLEIDNAVAVEGVVRDVEELREESEFFLKKPSRRRKKLSNIRQDRERTSCVERGRNRKRIMSISNRESASDPLEPGRRPLM